MILSLKVKTRHQQLDFDVRFARQITNEVTGFDDSHLWDQLLLFLVVSITLKVCDSFIIMAYSSYSDIIFLLMNKSYLTNF